MAAVSVYSVEGLAGLGGRLLFGVLADRFGAKRILVTALAVQAMAIAAYLAVNELDEFYALAVIFGVAYGGGMPLYASLARDYFGQHIMGTVFGAATMLSSLGMSIRAGGRRLGVRSLRHLRVALHRVRGGRRGRGAAGAAVSQAGADLSGLIRKPWLKAFAGSASCVNLAWRMAPLK